MKNGDFKTYHSNGELWKISLYTNDKEIVKILSIEIDYFFKRIEDVREDKLNHILDGV